ncbi:hypothetical protein PMI08_03841 [Brevibacillus sp. CF112]|nr:hypothetical protein [Brevibacillus sp. CF112]EJL41232.1 hypothetical protein PMI08_03841 [Brevibacillus sp. CF112]
MSCRRIAYRERYDGAILSLALGPIIGDILMYIFTSTMLTFRGQWLPEILRHALPRAIAIPALLLLGSASFISGALVLINYAFIVSRYLSPETPVYVLLILFVAVASFGALQASKTVLYSTELILILNVPLLLFSIVKAEAGSAKGQSAITTCCESCRRLASIRSGLACAIGLPTTSGKKTGRDGKRSIPGSTGKSR